MVRTIRLQTTKLGATVGGPLGSGALILGGNWAFRRQCQEKAEASLGMLGNFRPQILNEDNRYRVEGGAL